MEWDGKDPDSTQASCTLQGVEEHTGPRLQREPTDALCVLHDVMGLVQAALMTCANVEAAPPEDSYRTDGIKRMKQLLEIMAEMGQTVLFNAAHSNLLMTCAAPEEVIKEISELVFAASAKTVAFQANLPAIGHEVMIGRSHLQQVVYNLLRNALEAVPKVGGAITLSAWIDPCPGTDSLSPGRSILRIDILDNGPGIAPALHSKLFRLFASTKKNGQGIGLYHVKAILQGYGGSIAVKTAPRGGTILSVLWPELDGAPS